MNSNVSTLDASGTVRDVIQIMTNVGVGCVIVTDRAKPIGIVTERDVMRAVMGGREVLSKSVTDVMVQPLTSVSPETPVVQALQLMRSKNIRRLPVVSDERLQGIITVHRDLLYWALTALGGSVADDQ
ncbi:MAG TPA: CBS domain-containing protein [Candidatus Acidoferrales bacterium]|nr:CBS domain-containing protein [Candidatus Acidoferrales bacterium]